MIKSARHPQYVALIDWLITARKEQGITVRELGSMLDEDYTTIVKIETRVRKLSALEYYQFCKVLKLDPLEGFNVVEKSSVKGIEGKLSR